MARKKTKTSARSEGLKPTIGTTRMDSAAGPGMDAVRLQLSKSGARWPKYELRFEPTSQRPRSKEVSVAIESEGKQPEGGVPGTLSAVARVLIEAHRSDHPTVVLRPYGKTHNAASRAVFETLRNAGVGQCVGRAGGACNRWAIAVSGRRSGKPEFLDWAQTTLPQRCQPRRAGHTPSCSGMDLKGAPRGRRRRG